MVDIEPVRNFVRKHFLFDDSASLTDTDVLVPDRVDSLGVMELVEFLEQKYEITIDEEDLLVDNFRSLEAVSELIAKKRDARP